MIWIPPAFVPAVWFPQGNSLNGSTALAASALMPPIACAAEPIQAFVISPGFQTWAGGCLNSAPGSTVRSW